jgi:hypothetical protein
VEQPAAPEIVVKVEYFDKTKRLGFVEIFRLRGPDGKPEYLVRSEQTRWYGKVMQSSGEQVDQDLGSVVR